jgi:iron(III) transport system permease protein
MFNFLKLLSDKVEVSAMVTQEQEQTLQTPPPQVKHRSFDRPVQWGIFIITAILVIFPAWPILYQSVMNKPLYDASRSFTLDNFTRVLSNGEFWGVLGGTVVYALATTILAVVIGATLAVLLTRTDMPGRRWLATLIVVPFYISPLILAFAWIIVFGPQGYLTNLARNLGLPVWDLYSLAGITIVTATYYMPYAYLYCTSTLALADPQLESAARIGGAGPVRALWSVTVPLMRPALVFSTLLVLVSTVELLSIPLVLGTPSNVNVLSTYVYTIGIVGVRTDYGAIAVISILTVLLVTGLVMLQSKLVAQERRFVTVGGKATRPRQLKLGGLRWVMFGLVLLYVIIAIVLPLLGILAQAFTSILSPFINPLTVITLDNFGLIFDTPSYSQSIINSLLIAVIGGAIGVLFMAFCALTVYRSDLKGRKILSYLALYPRAFPGIIVGIGFLWAFLLIPGIGGVRNTIWVMALAFIMRHLPLGFTSISPAVLSVSTELDRAARVSGATWLGVARSIMLPLLRPALLSTYVLLIITFLKEYAVALFLFAPGSQVIGTTLIELWRQGNSGPISALATIQLVLTLIIVVISRKVLGVKLYEEK